MSFISHLLRLFVQEKNPEIDWKQRQRNTGTKIYVSLMSKYPKAKDGMSIFYQWPDENYRGMYAIRVAEWTRENSEYYQRMLLWNDQFKPLVQIVVSAMNPDVRFKRIIVSAKGHADKIFSFLEYEKKPEEIVNYVLSVLPKYDSERENYRVAAKASRDGLSAA